MNSVIPSILVPLDGSTAAARALPCARWLAGEFHARLHVLSATPRQLPAEAELARLHVPEEYWPLLALHQVAHYAESAILTAVERYCVELVVMSGRGAGEHAENEGV